MSEVHLELLTTRDVEAFYYLIKDNEERLRDYFPKTIKAAQTKNIAIKSMQHYVKLALRKELYVFGAKENENLLGLVFIKNIDWNLRKAEVAYFVDENSKGRGVATRMLSCVIQKAFSDMDIKKLYARIDVANVASARVVEKNNFQLEGVLRNEYIISNGSFVDLKYYGILNSNSV